LLILLKVGPGIQKFLSPSKGNVTLAKQQNARSFGIMPNISPEGIHGNETMDVLNPKRDASSQITTQVSLI